MSGRVNNAPVAEQPQYPNLKRIVQELDRPIVLLALSALSYYAAYSIRKDDYTHRYQNLPRDSQTPDAKEFYGHLLTLECMFFAVMMILPIVLVNRFILTPERRPHTERRPHLN